MQEKDNLQEVLFRRPIDLRLLHPIVLESVNVLTLVKTVPSPWF